MRYHERNPHLRRATALDLSHGITVAQMNEWLETEMEILKEILRRELWDKIEIPNELPEEAEAW